MTSISVKVNYFFVNLFTSYNFISSDYFMCYNSDALPGQSDTFRKCNYKSY